MYKSRYKSKKEKNYKPAIGVAVFLLLVFGVVSFLRADFMQVKSFKFLGAESVDEMDLSNVASVFVSGNKFGFIPKSNKLFLDEDDLALKLKESFGRLASVDVDSKLFSNTLEVSVMERSPEFIWCSFEEVCFFMDSQGLIFEKLDTGWLSVYEDKVVFKGGVDGDPLGKNFADSGLMEQYLAFFEAFENVGIPVTVVRVEGGNKVVAETLAGDMIFNPEEKNFASSSRNAILLIKDERAKNPNARFEYIDIRFGNKVFYKVIDL